MKKILLLLIMFIIVGCTNNHKIYLTDKYYNSGDLISIEPGDIKDNETFILYTYNNFCALPVHCEEIFKEVFEKYKIDALSIPFEEFKKTIYYEKVKYAPSIIIISNGKIVAFLDANSNEDLEKYQDVSKFEEWLNNNINLKK